MISLQKNRRSSSLKLNNTSDSQKDLLNIKTIGNNNIIKNIGKKIKIDKKVISSDTRIKHFM